MLVQEMNVDPPLVVLADFGGEFPNRPTHLEHLNLTQARGQY
jgi:hypothetical protein